MASSFRTNNLIVSGTMSGNGSITEIDTSSVSGNASNANYWIKVAECISDAGDKAQAEIHVSLEGRASAVRCSAIVYLRHGGSQTSHYSISVDLIDTSLTPNTQDNTDFILTYDTSSRKSQLWVRSNETFQKCYATIVSGTRQPNESFVNFYELTPGSTWAASITSLGTDLTATYTNRKFNAITRDLILTGNMETTGDISLLANSSLRFNNPGQNDQSVLGNNNVITLDGDLGVILKGNSYVYHNINDENANLFTSTYAVFNNANSNIDFRVRGGSSNSLVNADAGEDAIAIGASELNPLTTTGIGQDVLVYLSGSSGTKNSSTRGVSLVSGDLVTSGAAYLQNDLFLTGNIYMTAASGDQINWENENDFVLTAQNKIVLKVDNDGDSSNSGVQVKDSGGSIQHILYEDGRAIFNNSRNSAGSLSVRGSTDYGLIIADLTNNIAGLGSFTNALNSITGLGDDVKVFLSGSVGTKDTSTRGATLVSGDMVVSGNIYDQNGYGVVKQIDKGQFVAGSVAANTKYFLPEDSEVESSATSYRNTYVAPYSGSIEKLIIRGGGNTTLSFSPFVGLTGSLHIGGSTVHPQHLDTTPDSQEEVKVDVSGLSTYDSVEFIFTGSNFDPGDIYTFAIQPDQNWNTANAEKSLIFTTVVSYMTAE